MTDKSSKANDDLDYFLRRIDAMRISDRERINAKARFARAEAVAEYLVAGARAVSRLFAGLTTSSGRPPHRPASSAR